jgi:hypothetical protein
MGRVRADGAVKGDFFMQKKMEETIEACIQPCIEAGVCKDAESAPIVAVSKIIP